MQLMTPCQYGVALYLEKHDVQIVDLRIFWQRTLLSLASPKHGWAERRGTRIVLTATGRQILEATEKRFQHPRERKYLTPISENVRLALQISELSIIRAERKAG